MDKADTHWAEGSSQKEGGCSAESSLYYSKVPEEPRALLALRHELVMEGHSYPKCVGKSQFSRYVLPYMHSGVEHTSTQARTHGTSQTQSKRRKVNFCSLTASSQDHQHKQCAMTHHL